MPFTVIPSRCNVSSAIKVLSNPHAGLLTEYKSRSFGVGPLAPTTLGEEVRTLLVHEDVRANK